MACNGTIVNTWIHGHRCITEKMRTEHWPLYKVQTASTINYQGSAKGRYHRETGLPVARQWLFVVDLTAAQEEK